MNYLKEFIRIMESQKALALATSVNNIPNVRIVNFYYDSTKPGIAYFSTFKDNLKRKEFNLNQIVSFTTIPGKDTEHIKVINATVKESSLSIYDLKEVFINKIPDYEFTINEFGNDLVLYEIYFSKAIVTLDFDSIQEISL